VIEGDLGCAIEIGELTPSQAALVPKTNCSTIAEYSSR
jgi:hypothetical protein